MLLINLICFHLLNYSMDMFNNPLRMGFVRITVDNSILFLDNKFFTFLITNSEPLSQPICSGTPNFLKIIFIFSDINKNISWS